MHDLKGKGMIEIDRSATPVILAIGLENVRHQTDPRWVPLQTHF